MNKQEQIKFIEDNYPATTNHTSKRRIRHSFFSKIETELQAYLLGFYTADGSIDEKRKTLRIELQNLDSEIVYLFKDLISQDARIYFTKEREFMGPRGKVVHAHGSTGVDITSALICNDLVSLGIGYRKSWADLHIPEIPQELIRHFIRGYFDGDGSIYGMYRGPYNGRNETFRYCFGIWNKKNTLLIEIQKFFAENNIKINLNFDKRDLMYCIRTSSRVEIKKIYKLLYDNSNFKLSRKYDKMHHYVNTEVTLLIAEYRNALEMSVKESNNSPTSSEHSLE